jgi:hypothetical protein
MKSMMLTAYCDVTFPGRYWYLFPFIHVTLTDSNMPIACTAIIFLSKYFSFDPLNNIVFRNACPVWLCCIFENYFMQTEGLKKKKEHDMNCVFSV